MKLTLKVFDSANGLILSKVFDEGVYRIGRSEFSDIVLPHDSISRSQCEIRVGEVASYYTNMAGSGKVRVNGKRTETAELADGDELMIGPYRIVAFHGERLEEQVPVEPLLDAGGELSPQEDIPQAERPANEIEFPNPDEGIGAAPEPQLREEGSQMFATEGTAALKAETVVEIKPVVAKLVFTEGQKAGEEMFLEAYEVTMGRSKRADIFLDDDKLSRLHAKITRVGMGYRLIDLNSRNGTYVNGIRVLEHPLSSFDEIQIGNTKIKFLIHDLLQTEMAKPHEQVALRPLGPMDLTGSIESPAPGAALSEDLAEHMADELQEPRQMHEPKASIGTEPKSPIIRFVKVFYSDPKTQRTRILLTVVVLGLIYLLIPSGETPKPETKVETKVEAKVEAAPRVPPQIPKEFFDLSEENQREIEGYYNAAKFSADKGGFEEALAYLKKIHDTLPYYKESLAMQNDYRKRWAEARAYEAQQKAKRSDKADLKFYLEEGIEYLRQGDWERAGDAFSSATVLDPENRVALLGLRAAELKITRIEDLPPERDTEGEKREKVKELFAQAISAYKAKSYQQAIDTAEEIRKIELKGETAYLNQAKQIIDQARILQKEEFEPFLLQAKEKYAEGDYNASRDLCEEMVKADPNYHEAQECLLKAKKQLNRLAKEAYTHGYILESMNRIEDAKTYWNRAKNYVRPGDDYYDKVMKKLDQYQ